MLYDSTKILLQSILESLKRGDEAVWDDNIESGNQVLYELHQMSGSAYQPYKTDRSDAKWATRVPDLAKLNRAMPYVKSMMSAIRRRQQDSAIECAEAALAEMNGARARSAAAGAKLTS